jgi:hypothetical protein
MELQNGCLFGQPRPSEMNTVFFRVLCGDLITEQFINNKQLKVRKVKMAQGTHILT